MQLMIAAAPPLRQMACGTQLPIANAAYRIENGVLCALPMPPALRGGAMLLTGAAGPFSPETAAGVVQECRRRRYGTVIVPFPAAELTEALAQPLHRSGIALWVHEKCAHTAPGARVLVCTALSGGDIETGCPPAAVPSGRTVSCWTSSACGWTSLSPVPLVRAYR